MTGGDTAGPSATGGGTAEPSGGDIRQGSTLPKPFTAAEHEHRVRAVQRAMARHSFAALVVVDPANVYYLTGYNAWSFYMPQCLIVPADGDPHLFGRPMDMHGAHYTAQLPQERVHSYPEELVHRPDVHPFEWMTARAREIGVLPGATGSNGSGGALVAAETDAHFFSPRGYLALTAGLPNARVVDSGELVNTVRAIGAW